MILGKRDNELVEQLKKDRLDAIKEKDKYKTEASEWKDKFKDISKDLEEISNEKKELEDKIRHLMFIDFDKFAEMNDLTLKELAHVLNVSVSTLAKYRKDPTDMTPDRHKDIMAKLLQYKKSRKNTN